MSAIEQLLRSTLVIVAHPDDESIGCGVLLQRIAITSVFVCTDGAPSVSRQWRSKGYRTREEYARKRASEFHAALEIAGVQRKYVMTGIPDQQLHRYLQQAATHIEQYLNKNRPESILTHAYEGGHPDHDSCAFLGHWIGQLFAIPVWEMPFYHRREARSPLIYQQFFPAPQDEILLSPSPAEICRKECMLRQHRTQADVIPQFDKTRELFRPQPSYDFTLSPNPALRGFAVCSDIAIGDVLESFHLESKQPTHERSTA
jgi:N-acetylglucosamine malate deacetylase 2